MDGDNLINESDTCPTFVSLSQQRGCQKGMHDTSIILRYVMSFSRTAISGLECFMMMMTMIMMMIIVIDHPEVLSFDGVGGRGKTVH